MSVPQGCTQQLLSAGLDLQSGLRGTQQSFGRREFPPLRCTKGQQSCAALPRWWKGRPRRRDEQMNALDVTVAECANV